MLSVSVSALALDPPSAVEALRNTGKAVENFWTQFSAVNCTERVSQTKLDKDGKTVYKKDSTFDYLVLMRQVDGDLLVEESRVEARAPGKPAPTPLLVTSGFSTLLLVFHPRYQHSYEYSPPARDTLDGAEVWRIDFRHVPNAPSPSALRLRNRDYPLEWRGSAWIDPRTWSVMRLVAGLNMGMEDLGLKELTAEVHYSPVKFATVASSYWLPDVATIDARSGLQHWRNTHRFTGYKQFSVETKTKIELPEGAGLP